MNNVLYILHLPQINKNNWIKRIKKKFGDKCRKNMLTSNTRMSKSEDRERAWHHININIQYDINI